MVGRLTYRTAPVYPDYHHVGVPGIFVVSSPLENTPARLGLGLSAVSAARQCVEMLPSSAT